MAKITVRGAPPGQVRLAGSGPELGNWDPAKAPAPGELRLPRGGAFAFKPVVVADNGDVTWDAGDNRYLLVGPDTELVVDFQP